MTPLRIMLLFNKRMRKETIIRVPYSGSPPAFVDPPGPEELKDRKGNPALTIPPKNPEEKPKPS